MQATINPFVASFVNYLCTLHLHKVTVTNQTFFSWQGAAQGLGGRAHLVWSAPQLQTQERSAVLPGELHCETFGGFGRIRVQGQQAQVQVSLPSDAGAKCSQAVRLPSGA